MNSSFYQRLKYLFLCIIPVVCLVSACASPKKLLELEQEVNRIKITVEVLEKSNVEMNMKLDALTDSVRKIEETVLRNSERIESVLREQTITEKTRYEKEKASDFVVDRIYVSDSTSEDTSQTPSADTSESSTFQNFINTDAHQLYNSAFTHYKTGLYGKAILEFEEFVSRFPEHNLADNAQYWIGEVYYSQKDYNRSLHEFQKVLDLYPLGNKVPDAMLKIGFSYKELHEYSKSLNQFQKVIERFPDSDAAIKAREQMEIIRSEQ